jgi:hypothetical protein
MSGTNFTKSSSVGNDKQDVGESAIAPPELDSGILRHRALRQREKVAAAVRPTYRQLTRDVEAFAEQLNSQSALARLQAIIATNSKPETAMDLIASELQVIAEHELRDYLNDLLSDEAALSEVAGRSYKHANGFTKIVLMQSEWFKVRLHIWWPEADAAEHIHEHRWWFGSVIVTGTMISETFREATSVRAPEFYEYKYIAKHDNQPPRVAEHGYTKLVREQMTRRQAGDAYKMAPSTLHRVLRSEGLTATLVCQAGAARLSNRLLSEQEVVDDVEPNYLSSAELRAEVRRFLTEAKF